jgi:predicted dehydrogenase
LSDLDVDVVGVVEPAGVPSGLELDLGQLMPLDDLLRRSPDLVVLATPHDVAVELLPRLLAEGPTVLVEKPLGRSGSEARALAARQVRPGQLWVGFNYRFMPGVTRLLDDVREGYFGELIGVSMTLGHGGAPEDADSWKLDGERAGGGCLIDPGVHLLDLARLLAPAGYSICGGSTWSGFWNTGIEEECRLLLETHEGTSVCIDVSVVRWRSTFRIEIFGSSGYGIVNGRGRSYGLQEYRRGRRWGWKVGRDQRDTEEVIVSTDCSTAFRDELAALIAPAGTGVPVCGAIEAAQVMEDLDACRRVLRLPIPLDAMTPSA